MYVRRVSCLWVSCFAFIEFHQALSQESNRLKISAAPAECMRVADCAWQSWNWMAYAMYIKHARPTSKHATWRPKVPTKTARATAKLKLNGVNQVCQTGQADVNMQPAGQKCQLKHGRETNGVGHVYQTCQADAKKGHLKAKKGHLKAKNFIHVCLYLSIHRRYVCLSPYLPIYLSIDLSIYLSNLLGRREHATCRSKMPAKTWQGDEWRKPCISNMPSRRQKRPPEGQKKATWRPKMPAKTWQGDVSYLSNNLFIYLPIYPSIHAFIHLCLYLPIHQRYLCLSPYLPIYLSVKPARPTWTCSLQVKNAS